MSVTRRIAFDLDETLGVPVIERQGIVGWQIRPGCVELLDLLQAEFKLVLWSVSPRRYVDRALSFGLVQWFAETYSWDEIPTRWKDVRQIQADFLVDDSPHHVQAAEQVGLASSYILVPAYGSPEDTCDPLAWARLVESAVVSRG
jgi:FMN phosphatase YigB (HAD superfamily)